MFKFTRTNFGTPNNVPFDRQNLVFIMTIILEKGETALKEITEQDIEEMVVSLKEQDEELRQSHQGALMIDPEYQGWLMKTAKDIVEQGHDVVAEFVKGALDQMDYGHEKAKREEK